MIALSYGLFFILDFFYDNLLDWIYYTNTRYTCSGCNDLIQYILNLFWKSVACILSLFFYCIRSTSPLSCKRLKLNIDCICHISLLLPLSWQSLYNPQASFYSSNNFAIKVSPVWTYILSSRITRLRCYYKI